jgi:endonuclease/exonuclease/phosphatase family metal-dependent hydrolase
LAAVEALGLVVPTATLPHRIPSLLTIDHVAVPRTTSVQAAERVVAEHQGRQLSDHDAYIVTIG